jgi:prepilin-type N-terminal cleavage/methylation domain-containing protein
MERILTERREHFLTRKTDNRGFSLGELIIVIAIMAVLISLLAPQFIKYIEKSRVSRDESNAAEILRSVQASLASETVANAYAANPGTYTLKFANNPAAPNAKEGKLTAPAEPTKALPDKMVAELENALGGKKGANELAGLPRLVSNTYSGMQYQIIIEVKEVEEDGRKYQSINAYPDIANTTAGYAQGWTKPAAPAGP